MGAAIGIITGVVSAGAAAYSASQQAKAAKAANAGLGNAQQVQYGDVAFPTLLDWKKTQQTAIGQNLQSLPEIFRLAGKVNRFQQGQAMRGYGYFQPYFEQLQSQIGQNALSMARGELPPDVIASIGRASASRGLQSGFGLGANGMQLGTPGGLLNLRTLGLTSLDLSQRGTDLAMRANAQAQQLTPALYDPSSMFTTPMQALAAQQFNASAINNWNELNAGYQNKAAYENTSLANTVLQQQIANELQSKQDTTNAYASAASQLAKLGASYAYGQNNQGFYNTALGAGNQIGQYGGTVTGSQYGYGIRPNTLA